MRFGRWAVPDQDPLRQPQVGRRPGAGAEPGRVETDRWIAFRSHFNIESFYCRPGIEGAHEKGGVEGMIGYFRRNHFTPARKSTPSLSSTRWSTSGTCTTDTAGSARGLGPWTSTSPSSTRC